MNAPVETISVAAAAGRLNTNSAVIQRWIAEGHIPSVPDERGYPWVKQAPFEAICQEISAWLRANFLADEEGYTHASVSEVDQFWRSRQRS